MLVTLVASLLYENILTRQAEQTSQTLAEQTFNARFQVMRQGWTGEQLEAFLDATQAAFADSPYEVEIYRGLLVEELYGRVEQPPKDESLEAVFKGEGEQVIRGTNLERRIYLMQARQECLSCHVNAEVGDVLGVIDIGQRYGHSFGDQFLICRR